MEYVTLNNEVKMPILGFGCAGVDEQNVYDAIMAGYRLIDTAALYQTEEAVGKAVKRSGVPREELFISTKLWVANAGYENARRAFESSLHELQMDYIDLYLIHAPFNDVHGTWRAMEELYKAGRIRAIGVSNFPLDRVIDLALYNEVAPAVNQIEIHPFFQQSGSVAYLKENNIQAEAFSPLSAGKNNLLENELLKQVAAKYNRSVAQIVLRWHIQRGTIAIPKSVRKDRIIENIRVFDFELSTKDMEKIATSEIDKSAFFSLSDPEMVKRFKTLGE